MARKLICFFAKMRWSMKTISTIKFRLTFAMVSGLALMTGGSTANAQKGYPVPTDDYVTD